MRLDLKFVKLRHTHIPIKEQQHNQMNLIYNFLVCTTIQNHLKLRRLRTLLHHISTVCITCLFLIGTYELLRSDTPRYATECFHQSKVEQLILFLEAKMLNFITVFKYFTFNIINTHAVNISMENILLIVDKEEFLFLNQSVYFVYKLHDVK